MTSLFARRVAELTGASGSGLRRLSGGDLSEILLVDRPDGRTTVAKGGSSAGAEAAMLRALRNAGVPAATVEAEHDGVLLLDYVENDRIFSPSAWRAVGSALRVLHNHLGENYGWPVDYRIGTVDLDNREASDWPRFWGAQRLVPAASLLDRPWRERIDVVAARLPDLLPASPAPGLLHGDLWSGNILVNGGDLAAFIDPACYHGHREVDLAMLTLFDAPPDEFWSAYGDLEAGWEQRRPIYQLFPALVHLRLFGAAYAPMVERLLESVDQRASSSL